MAQPFGYVVAFPEEQFVFQLVHSTHFEKYFCPLLQV
jgi:hypothetical protein